MTASAPADGAIAGAALAHPKFTFMQALGDGRWLLVGLAAYFLTLMLTRALYFAGAGGDDAEQLLFAQDWRWGYGFANPPLYTWLVKLAEAVFGPTLLAVGAVKFALLWTTYALLFTAGRAIGLAAAAAALAALMPFGLYYVAWDAVTGYSHSILLMAVCAATFLAWVRLDRRDDTVSYLLLGACLGLGMLAKYGYGLFWLAWLGAALFDRRLRARVLDRRFPIVPAVALLLLLPHGLWLLDNLSGLATVAGSRFRVGAGAGDPWSVAATGAVEALRAVGGFSLPLSALFVLGLPQALRRLPRDGELGRWRRLLGLSLLLFVALVVATTVLGGATRVRGHYMFAMILLPLYLGARAGTAALPARQVARFAALLLLLAAVVPAGLLIKYWEDPLLDKKSPYNLPYAELAQRLRAAGLVGGTAIAGWQPYDLSGNLVPYLRGTRVVSAKHGQFAPPPNAVAGPCLLLWSDANALRELAAVLRVLADGGGPVALSDLPPARSVVLPFATTAHPVAVSYILLPDGYGSCR